MKLKEFYEGWVTTQRDWTKVTEDTGVGNPQFASAEKGNAFLNDVIHKLGTFLTDLSAINNDDLYEK